MENCNIRSKIIKTLVWAVMAVACVTFMGCSSSSDSAGSSAPEIPPSSTMSINVNDFQRESAATDQAVYQPSATIFRTYWEFSALKILSWNTLLAVNLVIPVAAFNESFNHQAVQQPDGSWTWTYTVSLGGINYTAKLNGQYVEDKVKWEMYISKEGEYTDFNWFSGENNLPLTQGYWVFRNNPNDPTDLMRIDWNRDGSANSTGDIKFTNISSNQLENGSYIFFGNNGMDAYDSYYDIYTKSFDNLTEIEWNTVTKEGRVKDKKQFGDENWHYWDSSLVNDDSRS